MDYIRHDLGYLSGGETVVITIDTQANVLLLDSINHSNYKSGRAYKYRGGFQEHSPIRMSIPGPGIWHIVINLDGASGRIRSSVNVVKQSIKKPPG